MQSPGLEHIRVLARRGGGIGRHAVLRWQWLRRASSTLALDTMTIRGCILRDAAFFVPFRKAVLSGKPPGKRPALRKISQKKHAGQPVPSLSSVNPGFPVF